MEDIQEELLTAVQRSMEVHKKVFDLLDSKTADLDKLLLQMVQHRHAINKTVDRLLTSTDINMRSFALEHCGRDLQVIEMAILGDCMHASGLRKSEKKCKDKFRDLLTIAARPY